MKTIGLLLAVLTVLAAGSGLTLALWRRSAPILAGELFAWSWLLGAGLVSAMLALGGIVLSGGALMAVVGVVTVGLGVYTVRCLWNGVRVESGIAGAPAWEKWIGLLALVPFCYLAWAAFRDAMMWDGLFIWEAKARHAFLAGGSLPASYFSDETRVRFHPSYPLYLPFTELWFYLCVGECDQTAVKLVFALFFAAAIATLWSGALRLTGRPWVAALTALLPLFVPYMADHGLGLVQGYADIPLGTVYLAGVSALLAWRIKKSEGARPIAVACAALLPWIKQEGSMLLLPGLIALAAMMHGWREWKRLLLFVMPAVIVAVSWRIALRLLHVADESVFHPFNLESLVAGLPRVGIIVERMRYHFSVLKNWNILWFAVPVAWLSLAWQRRREAIYLAVALLVPLMLDFVPYVFTKIDFIEHVTTSVDRLFLQISLVAVLTLGLALPGPEAEGRKVISNQ